MADGKSRNVSAGRRAAQGHQLYAEAVTYLEDGRVPVDNNRCERTMQPVALGRKAWLFAGSQRAGERLADLMSLVETARLNGLEPWSWLRDVLEKLPSWPASRLDERLPYAQKPQQ